jgi:predicted AAA+ superfamily ATPase
MSSVARDCAVKRPTVENYFSIIEDTLLGYLLYPLDSGIRVKERRHLKFYWVDSGLVRAIGEDWGNVSDLEKGTLFKGLILMILKSYQSYKDSFDEISYWASADVEVDFVLQKSVSDFWFRWCVSVRLSENLYKHRIRPLVRTPFSNNFENSVMCVAFHFKSPNYPVPFKSSDFLVELKSLNLT